MAFVQFSGVTYHDPDRAYGSYVLYTGADGVTVLIDLNGVVRNEWPHAGVPARIIDPALNAGRIGDIGVQLTQLDNSPGGIYGNRTVGQLSWTGQKLWEWGTEAPGGAARQTTTGNCSRAATASFSWRSRVKFRRLAHTLSGTRDSTRSHPTGESSGTGGPATTSTNSASRPKIRVPAPKRRTSTQQHLGLSRDQQRQHARAKPLAP
jgi:hypothetical protein